jgi:hypothetical protein
VGKVIHNSKREPVTSPRAVKGGADVTHPTGFDPLISPCRQATCKTGFVHKHRRHYNQTVGSSTLNVTCFRGQPKSQYDLRFPRR